MSEDFSEKKYGRLHLKNPLVRKMSVLKPPLPRDCRRWTATYVFYCSFQIYSRFVRSSYGRYDNDEFYDISDFDDPLKRIGGGTRRSLTDKGFFENFCPNNCRAP